MIIVNGNHRHQAFLTLQNDERPQWNQDVICVWHQYLLDGRLITTGKVIKLSKVTSTTSAILRGYSSCIDLLKGMIRYSHAFETEYEVIFSDTTINCMIEDMFLSGFFASDSPSKYVWYVRVARLVLKQDIFLSLLKHLSFKGAAIRNLGVTNVDDATVYSAAGKDVYLMELAVDCYV